MGKQTAPRRRTDHVTFDEFCDRIGEHEKADLIDGVIYLASPDNLDANDLHGWLVAILRPYVRKKQLGNIYSSRVAMRLDEQHGPEPDVLFLRTDRLHLAHRSRIDGRADLAIEIVSPDSAERDYTTKRELYESYEIPEYWIIDVHEQVALFLRLNSRGRYREVRPRQGIYCSEVLADFWLRVDWLWQHPLPDELDTIHQILAGPPPSERSNS